MDHEYNPKDYSFIFAGIEAQGFMSGTFLRFTPGADAAQLHSGAGGDITFIKSNNDSGIFEVSLIKGSLTNDLYSAMYRRGKLIPRGGFGPVLLKHNAGPTVLTAPVSLINRLPEFTLSDEEEEGYTWSILAGRVTGHLGGSALDLL